MFTDSMDEGNTFSFLHGVLDQIDSHMATSPTPHPPMRPRHQSEGNHQQHQHPYAATPSSYEQMIQTLEAQKREMQQPKRSPRQSDGAYYRPTAPYAYEHMVRLEAQKRGPLQQEQLQSPRRHADSGNFYYRGAEGNHYRGAEGNHYRAAEGNPYRGAAAPTYAASPAYAAAPPAASPAYAAAPAYATAPAYSEHAAAQGWKGFEANSSAQIWSIVEAQQKELQELRRAAVEEEMKQSAAKEAEAELSSLRQQLESMTTARDAAVMELAEAHEAQQKAESVLQEEKDERLAAEMLCRDLFDERRRMRTRNIVLEQSLAALLVERESRESRAASPTGFGGGSADAASSSEPEGFNLSHTRSAVEAAVLEAARLPEDERKKKIRSLRLKWHPDKHEVLKDIANEVTKCINEAVERHIGGDV